MTTQRFKTLLQGNVDAIYYNEKLYIGKREEVFVFNENTNNFDLYYHLAGKDINLSCLHLDEKKSVGSKGHQRFKGKTVRPQVHT